MRALHRLIGVPDRDPESAEATAADMKIATVPW
jgi:hypothetical protein